MNKNYVDCFYFFNQKFKYLNYISLIFIEGFVYKFFINQIIPNFLNKKIRFIDILYDCNSTDFDFSKFINLKYLFFHYNDIFGQKNTLTIPSKCVYLDCLSININYINTLSKNLKYLECSNCFIDNLGLMKDIRYLSCTNCFINDKTQFYLGNFSGIMFLDIRGSNIERLQLSNCYKLKYILLFNNKDLKEVDLSNIICSNLMFIGTNLRTIDLSNNIELNCLICANLINLIDIKLPKYLKSINLTQLNNLINVDTHHLLNKCFDFGCDKEILTLIDPKKIFINY